MRHSVAFFAVMAVAVSVSAAAAQTVVIHDPTQPVIETRMTAAEQRIFDTEAISAAKRTVSREVCEPDISISGVIRGAFSRAGSKQSLIFYQYCQTGNGFGQAGLVLIEGDRLAGNFIAEAGWTVDMGRIADVNKNGLDEFTLVYSGGLHQGQGGAGVDLMEFADGMPRGLGWYQAEKFDDTQAVTVWKLSAKPGQRPVFYRQRYFSGEGEDYKAVGKNTVFTLGKAYSKFRAIK